MKKNIKLFIAILFHYCFNIFNRKHKVIVLYYHGILASEAESFKRQMTFLVKHFDVIPIHNVLDGKKGNKNSIIITFDDAFENLLTNALPILKELYLPATVFVPANNLNSTPRWEIPAGCPDKQEPIMAETQIQSIHLEGITIGSHTLTHPQLSKIPSSQLEDEIGKSKEILEKCLNEKINYISYPHGDYNAAVLETVEKHGYEYGFTIEAQTVTSSTKPHEIPRFSVNPNFSMFIFNIICNGSFSIYSRLEYLKRMILR